MPSSGSSSVTAGVNLGTDTSASIQFSMSANWSELKFTSKTSAATGVYGATWCDGSRSDYTQYSSEYLGAFIFQYKGDSGVYLYMDAKYYGTYSGVISKDSKGMVLKNGRILMRFRFFHRVERLRNQQDKPNSFLARRL